MECQIHRVFEAICETRRLNKAGYAKFRNFWLYGERGLAGKAAVINIFQDLLTLEHGEEKRSRYSVEWQPDERHLARVGNPRIFQHPYHSPQLELWETGEVEWFVIIRTDPPVRRCKRRGTIIMIQPPLWSSSTPG
jgi:hypothetical protein